MTLQLKLFANSGRSCSTEFVRYSSGACGSVCAWLRSCSGRVCVHHCCAYAIQKRCSGVYPSVFALISRCAACALSCFVCFVCLLSFWFVCFSLCVCLLFC